MRKKLDSLPELPPKIHPFFLLPERRLSLKPMSDDASSLVFTYREAGEGQPILFFHGLWTTAYTFRYLIDPLVTKFRLILIELFDPTSQNFLPTHAYRPQNLAVLFSDLQKALGLEKTVVVAHAESALAAILGGLSTPEQLLSLVCISAMPWPPLGFRMKSCWHRLIGRSATWSKSGFKRPQEFSLRMMHDTNPSLLSRQEVRRQALGWASWPSAQALSKIITETCSTEYRQEFFVALEPYMNSEKSFPVPVKLLHGKKDRIAGATQGTRLQRMLAGSELLVAENSAGAVHVEEPQWTAEIIESVVTQKG